MTLGLPASSMQRKPYKRPRVWRQRRLREFLRGLVAPFIGEQVGIVATVSIWMHDQPPPIPCTWWTENRTFWIPMEWVEAASKHWTRLGLGHTLEGWPVERRIIRE